VWVVRGAENKLLAVQQQQQHNNHLDSDSKNNDNIGLATTIGDTARATATTLAWQPSTTTTSKINNNYICIEYGCVFLNTPHSYVKKTCYVGESLIISYCLSTKMTNH
jgi:hypothetical protein